MVDGHGRRRTRKVNVDLESVWQGTWVVLAAIGLAGLAAYFIHGAAPIIITALMAFFASIAMEPAVAWLSRFMPRLLATTIVLGLVCAAVVLFIVAFGGMLKAQAIQLVQSAPDLVTSGVGWANSTFGTAFDAQVLLNRVRLDSTSVTEVVTTLAGGLMGIVNSLAMVTLSTFSFLFFTFYFTAGAPRLRIWVAQLFPPRQQVIVLTLWGLMVSKIGGYVAARVILAAICSSATAVFLFAIDMPYWLPLGLWTGIVAQVVPTVGTYLAIIVPVLVGLVGPDPSKGIAALAFAIGYQQLENLTWEPQISARAVRVHPAVSFASAMMGATLFGIPGALVGVPVGATLMAIFDIYKQRYEISSQAEAQAFAVVGPEALTRPQRMMAGRRRVYPRPGRSSDRSHAGSTHGDWIHSDLDRESAEAASQLAASGGGSGKGASAEVEESVRISREWWAHRDG